MPKYDIPTYDLILLDNAQLLNECKNLLRWLQSLVTTCIVYLAFSPIVSQHSGHTTERCKLKIRKIWYFTPFSTSELTKFKLPYSQDEIDCFGDARNLSLLPGLVYRCITQGIKNNYFNILNIAVSNFIKAFNHHAVDPDVIKTIVSCLLNGLQSVQHPDLFILTHTGFVYYSATENRFSSTYPISVVLSRTQTEVNSIYEVMAQYNAAMALEFKFAGKVLTNGVYAQCLGSGQSVTGRRDRMKNYHLKCFNYVQQQTISSSINAPSRTCTLVKLVEGHPALDFLIISKLHGRDSNRLFLVQVSLLRYENRNNQKRFGSIFFENYRKLHPHTPLDYYSRMLSIPKTDCFYVYASTEDPSRRSRTDEEFYDRIYFAKVE